jgi:hypothetical protein
MQTKKNTNSADALLNFAAENNQYGLMRNAACTAANLHRIFCGNGIGQSHFLIYQHTDYY